MWKKVRVVAEPGTEFGVVSDNGGELVLAVRPKRRKWPGVEPQAGRNTIENGSNCYIVMIEEESIEST